MKTLLLTITLLITCLLPSEGIEIIPTFNDARKKAAASNADFIVCAYGDGWEKLSSQFKEKVWDNEKSFSSLESQTILTTIRILENPTKEQEEDLKKIQGDFKESIHSLPQIYLFDKTGFCYAKLRGTEVSKNPSKLVSEIKELQNKRKKRDDLIARSSQAASKKDKGRFLGQAYEIPDLNRPKSVLAELKKVDPEDESGYQKRFSFNIYDYHKYLDEPKEKAMQAFKDALNSSAYTNQQKQSILGVQSTYQRKHNAPQSELGETFRKMNALDPHSINGKAATNAAKSYINKEK